MSEFNPNISDSYGPKFAEIKTTREDFEIIKKHMPLFDYLRYIEENSTLHSDINTCSTEELLKTGISQIDLQHLNWKSHLLKYGVPQSEVDERREFSHLFITGTHRLVERGDGSREMDPVENAHVFVPIMVMLKETLLPKLEHKTYVTHMLPEKTSKLVHYKTVHRCMINKTRFQGGFVMPGYDKPVATTILDPVHKTIVTVVAGGLFGNFNVFASAITPRRLMALGSCAGAPPARLIDVPLQSGEHALHLFKAFAAVEYPAAFGAEGYDELNLYTFECLKTEPLCKKQKKLGQQVKLNGPRFFAIQPKVNPKIMALGLILRMSQRDGELVALFLANVFHGHKVVLGAMHGGEGGFSGADHDFAWSSVGGAPGVFLEPDTVEDGTPRKRFFELGIAHVENAWRGDPAALAELGLSDKLTQNNLVESAARIFITVCDDLAREARVSPPGA
jgi:hypothetical protein